MLSLLKVYCSKYLICNYKLKLLKSLNKLICSLTDQFAYLNLWQIMYVGLQLTALLTHRSTLSGTLWVVAEGGDDRFVCKAVWQCFLYTSQNLFNISTFPLHEKHMLYLHNDLLQATDLFQVTIFYLQNYFKIIMNVDWILQKNDSVGTENISCLHVQLHVGGW